MKAIRVHKFGEPEVMRLEEVPDPQPGPGEVLVQVRAVGVNPVDTYIRSGAYPVKPTPPYTPGMDAAGIVEAVDKGVTRFKAGDRVYTAGAVGGVYAEKALCKEEQVHPLPDNVSFSQGAGVGVPYGAAFRALFQRAHALAGEVVLVHGASGGVGIAAVQLAKAFGMTVIGTVGTDEGRRLARKEGAHFVFDHHLADHLEEAVAVTSGRGVDVILEMLANVNLGKDLGALAMGGRVVVIGSRGRVEIDPRDAMGRDAAILGMSLFNASRREMASIHAALGAGLENGTLRPIVSREMRLDDAAAAHHAVMETSTLGKIVLIP